MIDLLTAYALVSLAELGDKTQLVVAEAAARRSWRSVLAPVVVGILVVQTLSVVLGATVATLVPARTVGVVAGVLFIGLGAWAWRRTDEGADDADTGRAGEFLRLVVVFVVAELGDKTMLATAALAADRSPLAVWVGSTLAMIGVAVAAIVAGRFIAERIGADRARRAGAIAFVVIGVVTLVATVIGSG